MDSPVRRLIEFWFDAQVELHGQYSLARLDSLDAYARRTPMWRVILVCVLTPAIAIVLITLTDAIPLQDPVRGLGVSHTLWLRDFITICAVSGGAIIQLRIIVPKLTMSYAEVIGLTVVSSAAAVATQFGYAVVIGYPVPFGLVLGTPSCFVLIVAGVTLPRREALRANAQLRGQLRNYMMVLICQVSMTVVYPVYNYVFIQLSSTAQTAFVMLLPVIKLINKNWISHLLRDNDDLRPEIVVFNIEVFHALYVSICMQSSTSIYTTIAIMAIDFTQAWLSIRDVNELLRDVEALMAKVPPHGRRVSIEAAPEHRSPTDDQPLPVVTGTRHRNIMEAAIAILQEDQTVRSHATMRQSCFASDTVATAAASQLASGQRIQIPVSGSKYHQETSVRSTVTAAPSGRPSTATVHPICSDDVGSHSPVPQEEKILAEPSHATYSKHKAVIGLDAQERVRLVQKALGMLFLTEFVVLVEYAEVMVPIIYNTCTIGMVKLPNRAFYKQLASQTDDELQRTFGNVAFYGTLELVSFLVFCLVLRHKLRFSVLTQVAFVLENQFVMVQAKLMMWVFYVIQTSLLHFGADFSFSFSWLRKNE